MNDPSTKDDKPPEHSSTQFEEGPGIELHQPQLQDFTESLSPFKTVSSQKRLLDTDKPSSMVDHDKTLLEQEGDVTTRQLNVANEPFNLSNILKPLQLQESVESDPFSDTKRQATPAADDWKKFQSLRPDQNTVDPVNFLPTLDQCDLKWKLANQFVTPFDFSQLVQTLNHPQKPGAVIQVQMITENVKSVRSDYESVFKIKDSEIMTCLECGGDLVAYTNSKENDLKRGGHLKTYCDVKMCGRELDHKKDNAFFSCEKGKQHDEDKDKDYCLNCVTGHYGRNCITNKTRNHHSYQDFEFKKMEEQNHLYKFFGKNDEFDNEPSSLNYGPALQFIPDEEPHTQTYANVSFWTNSGSPTDPKCYHEFIVDRPRSVLRDGSNDMVPMKDFLFLSDDLKSMFCFSGHFSDDKDLKFHLIDLTQETPKPVAAAVLTGQVKKLLKVYLTHLDENQDTKQPTARLLEGDIVCFGTSERKGKSKVPSLHFLNWRTSELKYSIKDAKILFKQTEAKTDLATNFWVLKTLEIKVHDIEQELRKQQRTGPRQMFSKETLQNLVRSDTLVKLPTMIQTHSSSDAKGNEGTTHKITLYQLVEVDCLTGIFVQFSECELIGTFIDVEIEGYIHYGQKRCTIIAKKENWFTFELSEDKKYAKQILKHSGNVLDAMIIQDFQGISLKVVGRMKPVQRDASNGNWHTINEYSMGIVDLNQNLGSQSKDLFAKLASIIELQLTEKMYFQVTSQFKRGNLPMKMMPFTLVKNNTYQSQVFYIDLNSGKVGIYLIVAQKQRKTGVVIGQPVSTVPPILVKSQVDFTVEHPILCYTSADPQRTSLMVCNLQKNIPQKKLHLRFRFLCFVDTRSLVNDNDFCCEIDFLGLNSKQVCKLYRLSVNPFDSAESEEYTLNEIYSIDFNFGSYSYNQIKKASLMTFKVPLSYDTKHAMVVQLPHNILLFQKDQVESLFSDELDEDKQLAPLFLMQRSDRCYFVKRSEKEGDELVCLKFDEVTYEVIQRSEYKQKEKILQMQLDYDVLPSKQEYSIYGAGKILILDTSYKLRVLMYENQKKYTSDVSLVEIHNFNMSELPVKRLFRALELIPWQKCVLSQKAILCARVQSIDLTKPRTVVPIIHRDYTIYSVDSKTYHVGRFLGFANFNGHSKRDVMEVEHMRGIGKVISLVNEKHFSYFQSSQSPVVKRIDLLKYTQLNNLKAQINVVRKNILISFQDKFLIYNQKTLMLEGIFKGGNLDVVDDPSCQDQLVEFKVKDERSINHISDGKAYKLFNRGFIATANFGMTITLMRSINFGGPSVSTLVYTMSPKESDDVKQNQQAQNGRFNYRFKHQCIFNKSPILTRELKYKGKKSDVYEDKDEFKWNESEMYIFDAIPDRTYDDFDAQIYYIHFTKTLLTETLTVVTKNYYVFSCQTRVWFIEKEKIKKFRIGDERSFNFSDYKVDHLIKYIDMTILFQGEITYSTGMNIKFVSERDMYMVTNSQEPGEAIQVSFKDEAMIWDLEKNSEIQTLMRISEFTKIETYTRTGFTYYRTIPVPLDASGKSQEWLTMTKTYCKYFQTNQDCSIICAPETDLLLPACFRTHTLHEIYQLKQIDHIISTFGENRITEDHISLNILTSNFKGHTFFTQFYQYTAILALIEQKITDQSYGPDTSEKNDDVFIRRIFYTICSPFCEPDDPKNKQKSKNKTSRFPCSRKHKVADDEEIDKETPVRKISYHKHFNVDKFFNKHNLVQWLIKKDKPEFEQMISLIIKCKEVSLRALIQSFDHFKSVFNIQCDAIDDFMQKSNIETPMTKKITNLVWDPDVKKIVFTANTAMYSNKMIKYRAKEIMQKKLGDIWIFTFFRSLFTQSRETSRLVVDIRIIEVSWLNHNIPQFYEYLAGQNRPSLFDNELIKVLLQQQHYTNQIVLFTFLPYMVYMILLLAYFIQYVPAPMHSESNFIDHDNPNETAIRVIISVLSLFLASIELQQMVIMKADYWGDVWNYGNLSLILINLFIIVEHGTRVFGIEEGHLVTVTTIATIQLWLMFYYWWRLFPETAFYVKMLTEIILDLKYFILFYFMIICTFTSTQLILDKHFKTMMFYGSEHVYMPIAKQQTSNYVMDAWITQWILGLGEFDLDPFAANESDLQWFFFVSATFFTNIVFLNMLIAIMSDTFDKITEKKERNGMIQQTQLYADFIRNLKVSKKMNSSRFLYIITPLSEELNEQGDKWEGGYNRISERLADMEIRSMLKQRMAQRQAKFEFKFIKDTLSTISEKQRRILHMNDSKQKKLRRVSDAPAGTGLVQDASAKELRLPSIQLMNRESAQTLQVPSDNNSKIEQLLQQLSRDMNSKFDQTQSSIRDLNKRMDQLHSADRE